MALPRGGGATTYILRRSNRVSIPSPAPAFGVDAGSASPLGEDYGRISLIKRRGWMGTGVATAGSSDLWLGAPPLQS